MRSRAPAGGLLHRLLVVWRDSLSTGIYGSLVAPDGQVVSANAYPVVLGRLLGTNYPTRNFGVSGRTLLRKGDYPYWRETAFRNATNYAPDIVTLKLGTNDSKPCNW